MNQVVEFIKNCQCFYIATCEGDQPRVRPFGAIAEIDGKTYICLNNQKKVFQQLLANPKIEICAYNGEKWLRLEAKAHRDDRVEAREAMLNANPGLRRMYAADDGLYEVFYLTDGKATISSFTADPVEIAL
ncbi:MAG TPA: NimC/NimA family protein [Firmicutes bacterium]|nr:NimC/NimA family protein [Bacillota bacterium]